MKTRDLVLCNEVLELLVRGYSARKGRVLALEADALDQMVLLSQICSF